MKIDLEYYKTVVATQTDAEILRGELKDLISDVEQALPPSIETDRCFCGCKKAKNSPYCYMHYAPR